MTSPILSELIGVPIAEKFIPALEQVRGNASPLQIATAYFIYRLGRTLKYEPGVLNDEQLRRVEKVEALVGVFKAIDDELNRLRSDQSNASEWEGQSGSDNPVVVVLDDESLYFHY